MTGRLRPLADAECQVCGRLDRVMVDVRLGKRPLIVTYVCEGCES